MKKILVISDSHGDNEVIKHILNHEEYDLAIHAGDYCSDITFMKKHFDYFVDGNNDYEWKKQESFICEGFNFLLIHGNQFWSFDKDKWFMRMKEYGKQQNIDVVIFGHSHKSFIDNQTQPFLFNPGSVSLPRDLSATYGIIEIDKNKLTMLIEHLK